MTIADHATYHIAKQRLSEMLKSFFTNMYTCHIQGCKFLKECILVRRQSTDSRLRLPYHSVEPQKHDRTSSGLSGSS